MDTTPKKQNRQEDVHGGGCRLSSRWCSVLTDPFLRAVFHVVMLSENPGGACVNRGGLKGQFHISQWCNGQRAPVHVSLLLCRTAFATRLQEACDFVKQSWSFLWVQAPCVAELQCEVGAPEFRLITYAPLTHTHDSADLRVLSIVGDILWKRATSTTTGKKGID